MDLDKQDYRKWFNKRLDALKKERQPHEASWHDCQEFILPRTGNFNKSDGNRRKEMPSYDEILNSTATDAVGVFVAFIMAGMSSPARPWFRLTSERPGVDISGESRDWLDERRDLMLEVLARSNFYEALPRVYEEGSVYGNGCMYIAEDMDDIVRFYHYTAGEFWWGADDRRDIDSIYREFKMNVRAMVDRFGLENCSRQVQRDHNHGHYTNEYTVVHAVEPNTDRLPDAVRPSDKQKRFVSIYYERDSDRDKERVLSVSGFREFPVMPMRMYLRSDDPWAIGIGEEAMGDIKELQHHMLTKATALDYMNEPQLKTTGNIGQIHRFPGSVVHLNPGDGPDALQPVHEVRFPVGDVREDITLIENRIREYFKNHLARHILDNTRSNLTAREIDAGEQEKLLLAGPVLESIQNVLSRVIDRLFEIMIVNEVGPPPPDDLMGQELGVEFLGILAQAQKAVGTRAIERVLEFAATQSQMVGTADPGRAMDPFDNLDLDEQLRDFARMVGAPADQVRESDEALAVRNERSQSQQQQAAMAQAEQAANLGQTLANTPTGQGTALADAMNVVGGGIGGGVMP